MKIERRFTTEDSGAYGAVAFTTTTSEIRNPDGTVVFRNDAVEVPEGWSQVASDVIAQKYFRKAGVPAALKRVKEKGVPEFLWRSVPDEAALDKLPAGERLVGETSAKQVFDRLAGAWAYWGWKGGYFTAETDARAYYDEMRHMLARQMGAPNSPQWFNTGLHWAYGIDGPSQGHFYVDYRTGALVKSDSAYEHPQPHACFIQSVSDDLVNEGGIMDLWVREARLFKYGSGTGTNFSSLRGEGEKLSGGGKSSGLMGFLKIGDRAAGAGLVRDDRPVLHAHGAVREVRHTGVVGHDDHRVALLVDGVGQQLQDLGGGVGVQGSGGLVGDDQCRVVRHRDGDHRALAHAAGELVREGAQALLRLRDAHEIEQLRGAVHRLGLGDAVVRLDRLHQLGADVVDRGQCGQRVLEDHADAVAADLGHRAIGLAQQLVAGEPHGAGDLRVLGQKPHHRERGDGLAGAGLAHDAEGAAGVEVEVHAAHRPDHACFRGEGDVEVAHGQHRVAGRRRGRAAEACAAGVVDAGCHAAEPPEFEFGSSASRRPSAMNAMDTVSRVRISAGK